MRIGVLGTGRIGLAHARNLAQTTGVDEVVLMGRSQAQLAVSVEHVCAAIQPDAPPIRTGSSSTSIDRPTDPPTNRKDPMSIKLMIGLTNSGRTGQIHAASIAALPGTILHSVCDLVVDPNP